MLFEPHLEYLETNPSLKFSFRGLSQDYLDQFLTSFVVEWNYLGSDWNYWEWSGTILNRFGTVQNWS